jgi:branched-subunit amino acid ABC-type transport system permease component
MKPSMLIGAVLLVIGFATALVGILGVGAAPTDAIQPSTGQFPILGLSMDVAVPVISGLSLAIGALLVGLSMGNWRNPRSHQERGDEVVDPEGHHKMKHV